MIQAGNDAATSDRWSAGAERRVDRLDAEAAGTLADLLRHVGVPCAAGPATTVPLMWHSLYFHRWHPLAGLGPDGHPLEGRFMPPVPDRRRMFAGGRVTVRAPLRHGVEATADTRVAETVRKHGRTGELVFVTERTEIRQDGAVGVLEERDLVYRSATAASGTAPGPAGAPAPGRAGSPIGTPVELRVDAVSLFRFSALTANSHRIHYDERYAVDVEGFPALVVHGPLLALALAESCRSVHQGGEITRFDYRFVSPSFAGEALTLTTTRDDAGSTHAALTGPDGAIRARAEARHGRAEASRP